MRSLPAQHLRTLTLSAAVSAALLHAASVHAGTALPGNPVIVDGQNTPDEEWRVQRGGQLRVINGSTVGEIIVTGGTLLVGSSAVRNTYALLPAIRASNGATVALNAATLSGSDSGISLFRSYTAVGDEIVRATIDGHSDISGTDVAADVGGNSVLDVSASRLTGTGDGSRGLDLFSGSASLSNGTIVTGQANGVQIYASPDFAIPDAGRTLVVDGSTVRGVIGSAILVALGSSVNTASIVLRNRAVLQGGNGTAIEMAGGTSTSIDIATSDIAGDIIAVDTADARVTMHDAATLSGRVAGNVAMDLSAGGDWRLTGDSDISSLAMNGGRVSLGMPGNASYSNLTVRGDLGGSGGDVALNTTMNAGGALADQHTDRLLIEGDVTTTGTIGIVVNPQGTGALTDVDHNAAVDANEGISLVQVAGSSHAGAFALRGGYVAAGPWQYTLHAFGPGAADQAQNALANGQLNWDYRLGSRYVSVDPPVDPPVDPTKPVDPGEPGNPGDPGDPVGPPLPPPGSRLAVVPQLASYLSAPSALLSYGDMMSDGLRQRLGEVRNGSAHDALGGDVFARYVGGQQRYSSNLSFQNYGYDFAQQVNALQVGGSLMGFDGDNGSLRAGWALDSGTTRVTPKAVDGNSSAKYDANGFSTWMSWQQGSGLWVDGLLGSTRYRGDVGTDLRGADVGRVRGQGWTMSIETGMRFALGRGWTVEPRLQLEHRQLTFRDFTDGDGLDVRLGTAKQTSATVGGRIMRTAKAAFMPYANLDLTHTTGGDPTADVSSADWGIAERFATGRLGNAYSVAAGAVSQLSKHVQLYGQASYQHAVGGYGMRGWAGNAGVRVTF